MLGSSVARWARSYSRPDYRAAPVCQVRSLQWVSYIGKVLRIARRSVKRSLAISTLSPPLPQWFANEAHALRARRGMSFILIHHHRGYVGARDDRVHTRQLRGLRRVDLLDACMWQRAAQNLCPERAGDLHIRGVTQLAGTSPLLQAVESACRRICMPSDVLYLGFL